MLCAGQNSFILPFWFFVDESGDCSLGAKVYTAIASCAVIVGRGGLVFDG